MLSEQEKQLIAQAFNAAIKSSPDSMAAAAVLIPLYQKLVTQNGDQGITAEPGR